VGGGWIFRELELSGHGPCGLQAHWSRGPAPAPNLVEKFHERWGGAAVVQPWLAWAAVVG
jgi:hypothetical protein